MDAITKTNIEALPLIKFLIDLYIAKSDEDEFSLLTTIDADTGNTYLAALSALVGLGVFSDTLGLQQNNLFDLEYHRTIITLNAGAAANQPIYAPGAAYYYYAYLAYLGTDNTTNPNTTYYDIKFDQETTARVVNQFQYQGDKMGLDKIPLCDKGTAVDKDLQISIDNGQGAENIYVTVLAGKSTT